MAIPVRETRTKILICNVCGAKIEPIKSAHYIARNEGTAGLAAAISKQEETLYDAFDCPVCGCQRIAQERKYVFYDDVCADETSDKPAETSDKEENPECEGCEGCEYDDDPQGNPFSMMCVSCRRMYTDKYTKKVN